MTNKSDDPENEKLRSDFIRKVIQNASPKSVADGRYREPIPKTIVQFWHDVQHLPTDVGECIATWSAWSRSGFEHHLFDERSAASFIKSSLGERHAKAFGRCYHPAMQADYFRLCYLSVEGGFYVDADDECISTNITWLFQDGRLRLQPLCYDCVSGTMVQPGTFLPSHAFESSWIFYFNNNPLIANAKHSIIEHCLEQATTNLEAQDTDELPEIQKTAGPGNISRVIFDLHFHQKIDIEKDLVVIGSWDSIAVSKWPLSYRNDSRNWRLSNRRKFVPELI